MTTTATFTTTQGILDALTSLNSESDRWHLAEALLADVPQGAGNDTFKQIVDDAASADIKSLSVTSLRQYRDTAHRWPESKRVAGASFTAHREVQTLGIDPGADLLRNLVKVHGAKGVTTTVVRQAVAGQTGTTSTRKPVPPAITFPDLLAGAPKLLAAVKTAGLDQAGLDKLHAGLTAVLAEVEAQRVKLARKAGSKAAAAKAKPAAAPKAQPAPVPLVDVLVPAAESEPVAVEAAGDLRGL